MADNATTGTTGLSIAADEVIDSILGTVKVQYVKIMDGTLDSTGKLTVDAVSNAARTTLYSTSGTAVTFNTNGRSTPGNSAPVVMASQISQLVSSSTSAVALTATSSGAVGDWLDGFLVTPASTATGSVTLSDGSTGTSRTLITG